MENYSTLGRNLKRDIFNFSEKISDGNAKSCPAELSFAYKFHSHGHKDFVFRASTGFPTIFFSANVRFIYLNRT